MKSVLYRLSYLLRIPVLELRNTMSSKELAEWTAYFRLVDNPDSQRSQ